MTAIPITKWLIFCKILSTMDNGISEWKAESKETINQSRKTLRRSRYKSCFFRWIETNDKIAAFNRFIRNFLIYIKSVTTITIFEIVTKIFHPFQQSSSFVSLFEPQISERELLFGMAFLSSLEKVRKAIATRILENCSNKFIEYHCIKAFS